MTDTPDLSLALLDDILAELRKRYDAFIFAYSNNIIKDKEEDVTIYWHGGKISGIGLAEFTKHRILEECLGDEDEV